MAKDPMAHMMTPQEYLQKVSAGQMPQMNNHEMMVELGSQERSDQTTHDGISGPGESQKQVSEVAL